MTDRWPQLLVAVAADDLDALEEDLFDAGACSVTSEDAGDSPIFEPAPGTTPLWSQTRLRALFARGTPMTTVRDDLARRWPALHFTVDDSLRERDWEREWLRHFRPMRFGQRLWVCPGGMAPEQPGPDDSDMVVVTLDPGLAFGTGTHPTTSSCLRWLDAHPPSGARVLDFGCGSGILAIAALKLGAAEVTGVDIDPQAIVASAENARRNEVQSRLALIDASRALPALAAAAYDMILCNILAGPLLALAPTLAHAARPGAPLKLAGMLADQAPAVAERYAPWFQTRVVPIDDEWSAVSGTRKA